MRFSVPCICGTALDITAAQAGSEVVCRCGRTVSIPRLSDLRQTAGMGAYEASAVHTIHRMIAEGELPNGDACAVCAFPTKDWADVAIVCERLWKPGFWGSGTLGILVKIAFAPLLLKYYLMQSLHGEYGGSEEPIQGRHTVVHVPLRVCADCEPELRRMRSQRKLRRWVRKVPIYAQLLTEYSLATIVTTLEDAREL